MVAEIDSFPHHPLDDSDCIQTQINDKFHRAFWIYMLQLFLRLNNPATDYVRPLTGIQKRILNLTGADDQVTVTVGCAYPKHLAIGSNYGTNPFFSQRRQNNR